MQGAKEMDGPNCPLIAQAARRGQQNTAQVGAVDYSLKTADQRCLPPQTTSGIGFALYAWDD
jgi:hypothetical protein